MLNMRSYYRLPTTYKIDIMMPFKDKKKEADRVNNLRKVTHLVIKSQDQIIIYLNIKAQTEIKVIYLTLLLT